MKAEPGFHSWKLHASKDAKVNELKDALLTKT